MKFLHHLLLLAALICGVALLSFIGSIALWASAILALVTVALLAFWIGRAFGGKPRHG